MEWLREWMKINLQIYIYYFVLLFDRYDDVCIDVDSIYDVNGLIVHLECTIKPIWFHD